MIEKWITSAMKDCLGLMSRKLEVQFRQSLLSNPRRKIGQRLHTHLALVELLLATFRKRAGSLSYTKTQRDIKLRSFGLFWETNFWKISKLDKSEGITSEQNKLNCC